MRLPSNRRAFLKASLLTGLAALLPGNAAAMFSIGRQPAGRLSLYNTHTGESVATTYRAPSGQCIPEAIAELNWLLRCHYTDQQYPIDLQTLDFLDLVNTSLGGNNEIHIISGYRSPEYNDLLLSQGHRVSKHSLHMEGRAVDIRIPGIDLATLQRTALAIRMGGVGYYPRPGFVHIDSGKFRTW